MVKEWPAKGPNERLDYGFDWAEFIALIPGASISSATIVPEPIAGDAAPLVVGPVIIGADNKVSAFISGGSPKTHYTVICTIQIAVPGEASPAVGEWPASLFIRSR